MSIIPLTTNGCSISVREYKAIHEVGLAAAADFMANSATRKSKTPADEEDSSQENTNFQRLVYAIIRGFIPPKLRGFFTNPQAKEEYVKVTRDGIKG